MSYILDALKKSEKERQRGAVPSLDSQQDIDSGPPKGKKTWPYWLIGALVLNAAVLLWWTTPWKKGGSELPVAALPKKDLPDISGPREKSPSSAVVGTGSAAPRKMEDHVPAFSSTVEKETAESTKDVNVVPPSVEQQSASHESVARGAGTADKTTAPEENGIVLDEGSSGEDIGESGERDQGDLPVTESGDNGLGGPESKSSVPEQPRPQDNPVAARQPPPKTSGVKKGRPEVKEAVTDFSQLPVSIRQQLPEISISLHFYSKKPQRRKVSVNGRMLGESDRLDNLTVEEITPDGVIFSFQGIRFHKQIFR